MQGRNVVDHWLERVLVPKDSGGQSKAAKELLRRYMVKPAGIRRGRNSLRLRANQAAGCLWTASPRLSSSPLSLTARSMSPGNNKRAPPAESCYPSITMSKLTGDKARYNRNRKRKAAKRLSLRPLRAAAAAQPPPAK